MTKLELTDDETQALLSLMDLGVKHGGLPVAAAAAVLHQKITAAKKPKTNGVSPSIEASAP